MRFQTKFPNTPFDDTEECRRLIEVHRDWVLNGDPKPDASSTTYPLSHEAYSASSQGANVSSSTKTEYSCVPLTGSSNIKSEYIVDEMFESTSTAAGGDQASEQAAVIPEVKEPKPK